MNLPKRVWYYIFGPNLIRRHRSRNRPTLQGVNYMPNDIEATAERILTIYKVSKVILTYTMPMWGILIYRKGYYTLSHLVGFAKFAGWISIFYISLLFIRGFGRAYNSDYVLFLNSFGNSLGDPQDATKKKMLRDFDFDFKFWPVDFSWNENEPKKEKRRSISVWKRLSSQHSNFLTTIFFGYPKDFLAYLVSHSFGISMMYPGSTSMFKAACGSVANTGRSKLVEENNGFRAKLRAEDGNCIDTMFVDRRSKDHPNRIDRQQQPDITSENGNTLIICCEGNAGFYEGGCMCTPLELGYSVLGWNHPGFLGSSFVDFDWSILVRGFNEFTKNTNNWMLWDAKCAPVFAGAPFPEAEKNAIDVVMQYAIKRLGFQPTNIVIFAWSIGAFSGINAAINYPEIKGLCLDSTFNDVLMFGQKIMPDFAENFVTFAIRNHLNLNNAENLRHYKGPITFIRRSEDEVMNLDGPHVVASNLGNLLFEDFLRSRYPNLFESPSDGKVCTQASVLQEWLHALDDFDRDNLLNRLAISSTFCKNALVSCLMNGKSHFPMSVGEELSSEEKTLVLMFLAKNYMKHFSSTHCTPLPSHLFSLPWDPSSLLEGNSNFVNDFEVIA